MSKRVTVTVTDEVYKWLNTNGQPTVRLRGIVNDFMYKEKIKGVE